MARGRKRRRGYGDTHRKNALGWAILVFCLAVGGTLFWWHTEKQAALVRLDQTTLCPSTGPTAVTAVLIDRTDVLNPVQREAIRQALASVKNSVMTGELLQLYSVGPADESVREPLIELCNPGRGDEVSAFDAAPRLVEQRWRDGFEGPLQAIFRDVVETDGASRSPIMESMQSVSVTAFGPDDRRVVPRRLVLVSDMLQHTDGASHYANFLPFDGFGDTPYYRRVRGDLRDVEVEIFYIWRTTNKTIQGKAHVQFWRDLISDQGGTLVHVDSIEG